MYWPGAIAAPASLRPSQANSVRPPTAGALCMRRTTAPVASRTMNSIAPAPCGASTAPRTGVVPSKAALSPGARTSRPTSPAPESACDERMVPTRSETELAMSWMPVTVLNCASWPRNSAGSSGFSGSWFFS